MSLSLTTNRQKQLLRELARLAESRLARSNEIELALSSGRRQADEQFDQIRGQLQEALDARTADAARGYRQELDEANAEFHREHTAVQAEYDALLVSIAQRHTSDSNEARRQRDVAVWEANAVFDATKDRPKQLYKKQKVRLQRLGKQLDAQWRAVEEIGEHGEQIARARHHKIDATARMSPSAESASAGEGTPPSDASDPLKAFAEAVEAVRQRHEVLRKQWLGNCFIGVRPLWFFFAFWLLAIIPAGFAFGWNRWQWIAVSLAASLGICLLAGAWLFPIARRRTAAAYSDVAGAIASAKAACEAAKAWVEAELARRKQVAMDQHAQVVARRDSESARAEGVCNTRLAEVDAARDAARQEAEAKYPPRLAEIERVRNERLAAAEAIYPPRLSQLAADFQQQLQACTSEHAEASERLRREHDAAWQTLADQWRSDLAAIVGEIDQMRRTCQDLFPDWAQLADPRWTLPAELPPAIRFGSYEVPLAQIPQAIPDDPRLAPKVDSLVLPAVLSLPDQASLVMRAAGIGRDVAVETLRAVMLRLLTSVPSGKVRFTVFDPVGLGDNFSAFMHLTDYDELLITSRIWTERSHIEQRLTDLTEHMENVFQKYLRNEFPSIQEYNEYAGEVAEPLHILVVANFPVNFSEQAARRLVSIASSGPRCGVYTLVSVDTRQPLPHGFDLKDLERSATALYWHDGSFHWNDSELEPWPLVLDAAAPADLFGQIVRSAGEQSKDARRVEVAFERIAPADEAWWIGDSRAGLDIPLGRAGATKLQHMRLGRGTSQHVLIAGKTGSGKSSFLHALITNAALHYSPQELEFYLIDFKKGVEFKSYANGALPHARVIAIESEREFGLSVLERLDGILKERGDEFRRQGVQDLAAWRDARPEATMPRILLVIDEFQEFFVEDDRLAQNAALLLDRLVRQGRAFGIHVLLGSQTLGGAYSLARSTLGQMAVRIALQCSETDAHLILSEENTAARLLTRPGEAIYNDANGLIEGNHPFQIAWLPDGRRDEYLRQLAQRAQEQSLAIPPAIVFEGNVPADPVRCAPLVALVDEPTWQDLVPSPRLWLGASVAIKEPTHVALARQSGSHLLWVGSSAETALGGLMAAVVSLAAQVAPALETDGHDAKDSSSDDVGSPDDDTGLDRSTNGHASPPRTRVTQFVVLDGTAAEDPQAGAWQRLGEALPHSSQILAPGTADAAIASLAAEVARRQVDSDEQAPSLFLIVHNLGRFRQLRKSDDDFGFSRLDDDRPPSPGKLLADILRDGPAVGVHVLLWCDGYNNLERWLDRSSLRELELRVVTQMSATDSSHLIDSPAAATLGTHRALLYQEQTGSLEKFRPFAAPTTAWLKHVAQRLGQAAASNYSKHPG